MGTELLASVLVCASGCRVAASLGLEGVLSKHLLHKSVTATCGVLLLASSLETQSLK